MSYSASEIDKMNQRINKVIIELNKIIAFVEQQSGELKTLKKEIQQTQDSNVEIQDKIRKMRYY